MGNEIKIQPAYIITPYTPTILRETSTPLAVDFTGDLEVVEAAEELNDVAKLKESSTFDADIPYSTLNRLIVAAYGNKIPILANAHGYQLPDTQMIVNGYNEPSGLYDVSFVRDQEWPEFIKNLSLNELNGFAPFQLGEDFIDDNQLNDAAYDGTTRGFYTPLAYYGGLQRFNEANSLFELTYADFRLWFHYGKILEQAFCDAGWTMDCPFLRTEYGKRLSWYLVGGDKVYDGPFSNNYMRNAIQLPGSKDYAFKATKTADQMMTGFGDPSWWDGEAIFFENDSTGGNYDNGSTIGNGFIDGPTGEIKAFTGRWRYRVRLIIEGQASPISVDIKAFPNVLAGALSFYRITFVFTNLGGELLSFNGDAYNINHPGGNVTINYDFFVEVECATSAFDLILGFDNLTGAGLTVKEGSFIEGTAQFIVIIPDISGILNETIVFPQSWLSPKIKAIEVLEDYCHRTNSKIYTDRARRIVGIYTAHDVPTYGEETEPYYFDNIEQDLSGMQIENSATVNLKGVVAPGKYVLGFKDSTDAYVESVSKGEPFEAVIDMVDFAYSVDPEETFENRSNLVEPTLEREFVEIRHPNPNNTRISVMAVLDNLTGEPSTNVAPRTAYIYGLVRQKIVGSVFYKTYNRRWGGVTQTQDLFAYATQYPSGGLVDADYADIDSDKTLVYDHDQAVLEPMKRYWVDTIRVLYLKQTRKLNLIIPSFNEFLKLNFRNVFRFKFMGIDWKGRLKLKRTKVNDFRRAEIEVEEDRIC